MPVEFDRGSPGKFDSRTLRRETLSRWTGRTMSGGRSLFRSGHTYNKTEIYTFHILL